MHGHSGTVITSDHYDGVTQYPDNLNCRWKIVAPAGKVITLTFNVSNMLHDHLSYFSLCP